MIDSHRLVNKFILEFFSQTIAERQQRKINLSQFSVDISLNTDYFLFVKLTSSVIDFILSEHLFIKLLIF